MHTFYGCPIGGKVVVNPLHTTEFSKMEHHLQHSKRKVVTDVWYMSLYMTQVTVVASNRNQHGYFNQKRNVLEGDMRVHMIGRKQTTRLKTNKKQVTTNLTRLSKSVLLLLG